MTKLLHRWISGPREEGEHVVVRLLKTLLNLLLGGQRNVRRLLHDIRVGLLHLGSCARRHRIALRQDVARSSVARRPDRTAEHLETTVYRRLHHLHDLQDPGMLTVLRYEDLSHCVGGGAGLWKIDLFRDVCPSPPPDSVSCRHSSGPLCAALVVSRAG